MGSVTSYMIKCPEQAQITLHITRVTAHIRELGFKTINGFTFSP